MEDNLTQKAALSFTEFIKTNENIIKSHQGQSLLSFIFPAERIDLYPRINGLRKKQEVLFYSEKPAEDRFFLGINSILMLTEKGEKRFSSLEKKLKELRENFISNRREFENISFPLLMGGMKFTVEHSDENWKDFDDSEWFIPELIFLKEEGNYYFIFNSFTSPKVKIDTLLTRLEYVLKLFYTETNGEESSKLRIIKKTGDEPKDKKKWKTQVNSLLEKIEDGGLQKVVLSRKVELVFTNDISIEPILKSLVANYPECTLFLFHIGKSSFIGASPETLAKIKGSEMTLEVLAGSADRGGSDEEDMNIENGLLASKKNLNEHEIVINYINDCLSKSIEDLVISDPSVKKLQNIQHLKSTIKLYLNEHNTFINVIGKVHPTPAVCGSPADAALNLIKKTETHQRGLYAGLIGWLNLQNEGEVVLAIRSALAAGKKLIVYAGCGIVNGSNPDEEYRETELKLKPFLTIFNNEN